MNVTTREQTSQTAPPHNRRKLRGCLWLLVAVVVALIIALMPERPLRAIATYPLSPELDIELLQILSENEPSFAYTFERSDDKSLRKKIVRPIIKIMPARVINFLLSEGIITVHDLSAGSINSDTIKVNGAEVGIVFRFRPSARLLEKAESGFPAVHEEMRDTLSAQGEKRRVLTRFNFILASPDLRFQSRSEPVLHPGRSSSGTAGSPEYRYEWNPFGVLRFSGVPVRYPELDLIFLENKNEEFVSSSTMKIKNPRYRAKLPPPPGPVQPLPASAESNGLSLTLSRFVKDAAASQYYSNSQDGENGREIWERGDALREDITLGRPGGTSMQIAFHDHGTTTTDWQLSDALFYDETGTTISSGGWNSIPATGLHTHTYNVGALSSPLKIVISARQIQNWPDANYTTHTFALPPIKPGMLNQLSEGLTVGPHPVEITEVWFPGVGTSTGSDPMKSLSVRYKFLGTGNRIVMTEAKLLSDTTGPLTLTYPTADSSAHNGVQITQNYRLALPDYVTPDTLAAYTSISLTLVHTPVRRFELIVEPEEATIPVMEGEEVRWWNLR